ncbi:possible trypsin protease precursor [Vibrio mediterranei AK1]|uniref:trypsin-like serine protease n=1 Tax=Vibrio mediterranei TaxID=689 RepID=UPI0001542924|nr:trypsin-like serine protease [Vibrio mediterranei]EDL52184.1 possible trypsin protease precursor [Vibrio mediterranei AK1]
MKPASLLALSVGLISNYAFAIVNGNEVNWQNDFDDVVFNNCTGLIIGGDKILTAAHCDTDVYVKFADNSTTSAKSREDHPNYVSGNNYDVSVWTLPKKAETQNIHFLANINNQSVQIGDSLRAFGFGGDNPLAYASLNATNLATTSKTLIDASMVSGSTTGGDSGGMWLDINDNVVGIHKGSAVDKSSATDLYYAKDFLLEQINGWHYPTIFKGTGSQTIKVQSLHLNPTADSAYVDGDVTITGGTCYGNNTINAFDTCTYELEINGTGTLHLSGSESVSINPKTTPPPSNGGSGGGGGSMGWLSILALAVFGRFRFHKA